MTERVLYIDPGATSGLAMFEFSKGVRRLMYVHSVDGRDVEGMNKILSGSVDVVVIEDQFLGGNAHLKELLRSRFYWEAMARFFRTPVFTVMPRQWQCKVGLGTKMKPKDRKKATIQYVADTCFQGNLKGLDQHICDAVCMGLADDGTHFIKNA